MITLSEPELIELTGYRQRAKQKEVLASMSIPFGIGKGGTIKVVRMHVAQAGKPAARSDNVRLNLS